MASLDINRSDIITFVIGNVACIYGMASLPSEVLAPITPIIVGVFFICVSTALMGHRNLKQRIGELESELGQLKQSQAIR